MRWIVPLVLAIVCTLSALADSAAFNAGVIRLCRFQSGDLLPLRVSVRFRGKRARSPLRRRAMLRLYRMAASPLY